MIVWLKKFATPLEAEKAYFFPPTQAACEVAVQVYLPAQESDFASIVDNLPPGNEIQVFSKAFTNPSVGCVFHPIFWRKLYVPCSSLRGVAVPTFSMPWLTV